MPEVNYFDVLELRIDNIQSVNETDVREKVKKAHKRLLSQSLRAGSRLRSDGMSQTDWRHRLEKARDVLLDPELRRQHIGEVRPPEPEPRPMPEPAHDSDPPGEGVRDHRARETVEGAAVGIAASVLYLVAVQQGANTAAQFVAFGIGFLATLMLLTAKRPFLPGFRKFCCSAVLGGLAVGWLHIAILSFEILSSSLPQAASAALSVSAFTFVGAALGGLGLIHGMHQRLRLDPTLSRGAVAMLLLTVIPCVILTAGSGGVPGPDAGAAADGRGSADAVPTDTEEARASETRSSTEPRDEPRAPVPDVEPTREAEAVPSFDRSARRRIQGGLQAAGFYPGVIDGLFGPGTLGAIRNWQTARGAEATGYLDEAQAEELMALAEPSGSPPPRVAAGASDTARGRLVVRAEPGSRIDLDGIESGSTGEDGVLVLSGIQAGRHIVVAHKQGYASATGAVEIVSSDTHELELRAERYAPVDARADDLRGNRASPDVTLDGEVSLTAARSRFDAGDYEAAADAAQALLQVQAEDGPAHLLLGRAWYALGRFEDSIEPLRRAVALGERVELDARHRHGVGEFRQGFCRGVLTFGGGEVTFRSEEEGSHNFLAPADRITDVEVVESIDGQPFWLTSRVQDRGSERRRVDFVHRNVLRQFRSGNSRFSAILVCSGCDGSLGVQAALMRAGG